MMTLSALLLAKALFPRIVRRMVRKGQVNNVRIAKRKVVRTTRNEETNAIPAPGPM
jgi:hypothetical protein